MREARCGDGAWNSRVHAQTGRSCQEEETQMQEKARVAWVHGIQEDGLWGPGLPHFMAAV